MGGGAGGPMRAAAKVVALGGGLTTSSAFHGGATSALRNKGSMPVSTLSSSSSGAARESEIVEKSSWEIGDEWEEIPRVVFGGVPSYGEAEVATTELKEAVQQVYLSSENSPSYEGSSTVSANAITTPSIPNHALRAFKFLSETPAAQTVVASVASDPNVWNAVLQNPALVDFMHSCKSNANMDANSGEFVADDVHKSVEELSNNPSQPGNPLNGLMDILHNIKLTVFQMVSRVSDFLQEVFGPPVADKSSDADGHSQPTFKERTVGASVMGLAVLAIMVIVLKRN